MALRDPVDKNMLRMEARRFTARCEAAVSSIERADNLREVSRMATSVHLPYTLSADDGSRDSLRLLQTRAEGRARELIQEQLHNLARADESQREKHRRTMLDAWTNLTGPLGHLRTWAQSKLLAAEQQNG